METRKAIRLQVLPEEREMMLACLEEDMYMHRFAYEQKFNQKDNIYWVEFKLDDGTNEHLFMYHLGKSMGIRIRQEFELNK